MTRYVNEQFTVPRGGRDPETCGHEWLREDGSCVWCGAPCQHAETVKDDELKCVLCVECGAIIH